MGEILTSPVKEKLFDQGENNSLRYGSCEMQGWRKKMEDSHLCKLNIGQHQNYDIFGVFDGHGGKEVASFLKQHFIEELEKNENFQNNQIEQALIEIFFKMDDVMQTIEGKAELRKISLISKEETIVQNNENNHQIEMFVNMFDPKFQEDCEIAMFSGSTACICIIDNNNKNCFFANAGDSRGIICKEGCAIQITEDHKPDNEEERKRIYKAGGWVTNGRIKDNLNMSRSLGDFEYKQNYKLVKEEQIITSLPQIKKIENIQDYDFIILACDGVWDCKSNQEVNDFIYKKLNSDSNVSIPKIMEDLFDEIVSKEASIDNVYGCDNMTCIIIQIKK